MQSIPRILDLRRKAPTLQRHERGRIRERNQRSREAAERYRVEQLAQILNRMKRRRNGDFLSLVRVAVEPGKNWGSTYVHTNFQTLSTEMGKDRILFSILSHLRCFC